MASYSTAFGLNSDFSASGVPNYAPYFLIFGLLWTNGLSSARIIKKISGIDYMVAPREGVSKFGEQAVKDGKMTRSRLNMIKRNEAAHSNAFEAFPPFVAAVLFATIANVPNARINRACAVWTAARLVYHVFYLAIERGPLSLVRGVCFWIGNIVCISLFWQSAKGLNAGI